MHKVILSGQRQQRGHLSDKSSGWKKSPFTLESDSTNLQRESQEAPFFHRGPLVINQALYVEAAVEPPLPVQFVWKNSPLGLSTRS